MAFWIYRVVEPKTVRTQWWRITFDAFRHELKKGCTDLKVVDTSKFNASLSRIESLLALIGKVLFLNNAKFVEEFCFYKNNSPPQIPYILNHNLCLTVRKFHSSWGNLLSMSKTFLRRVRFLKTWTGLWFRHRIERVRRKTRINGHCENEYSFLSRLHSKFDNSILLSVFRGVCIKQHPKILLS